MTCLAYGFLPPPPSLPPTVSKTAADAFNRKRLPFTVQKAAKRSVKGYLPQGNMLPFAGTTVPIGSKTSGRSLKVICPFSEFFIL